MAYRIRSYRRTAYSAVSELGRQIKRAELDGRVGRGNNARAHRQHRGENERDDHVNYVMRKQNAKLRRRCDCELRLTSSSSPSPKLKAQSSNSEATVSARPTEKK
ncbi:hypothetical protein U1Q18_050902 [Sarracenia purpurea var. burkii]